MNNKRLDQPVLSVAFMAVNTNSILIVEMRLHVSLVLLNPAFVLFENTLNPDQLASEEAI